MRFSIITPSYGQVDWLRLCVASIRDQIASQSAINNPQPTIPSMAVEHIIRDGGTPGIEEFAREVGAEFYRDGARVTNCSLAVDASNQEAGIRCQPCRYRIAIYCEQDAGMYDAINKGLEQSKGDICAWLNCDEQYLPGALERVAREFGRYHNMDVLFGDALLVDGDGSPLSYRRTVLPSRLHTRLCHLGTLSCATFFRREAVVERGLLFDTRWRAIGDAVWVDSLLGAGLRMRALPLPLATFAFTGTNLSEANKGPEGEHAKWSHADDAPPGWLAKPAALLHRVRKALAGAYKRRSLDYSIYTTDDPKHRKVFHSGNLGAGWPGQTL